MMQKRKFLLVALPSLIAMAVLGQEERNMVSALEFSRDYDPGYQSEPCQININCPEASAWQQEKRSTVLFIRPDGGGCTGVLLNNSAEDGTPYLLTANHCVAGDPAQWTFYFNYESPDCVGDTGATDQTITGASIIAASYFRDFALLELSAAPPASFMPYYSGWDHSDAAVSSGTIIMHPAFDVKKIAFDEDQLQKRNNGTNRWLAYLDTGVVQFGASGAGLWDQNHRIVGHLFDGIMDCSNSTTVAAESIRFQETWNGTSATDRVSDWLDPSGTLTVLDGYDPFPSVVHGVNLDLKLFLQGAYDEVGAEMRDDLNSAGSIPLTEPYTALSYSQFGGGGETTTNAILAAGTNDAVVDWVLIELRSSNDPSVIMETQNVLLRKDGTVLNAQGENSMNFDVEPGYYHVAVRHRNHLPVMTAQPEWLAADTLFLDLASGSVSLAGGADALIDIGGAHCLITGDANGNGEVRFTGPDNDRDPILTAVGGSIPTNTVSGYLLTDLNMDGLVKYTGPDNDRDVILMVIGGSIPTNVISSFLP